MLARAFGLVLPAVARMLTPYIRQSVRWRRPDLADERAPMDSLP